MWGSSPHSLKTVWIPLSPTLSPLVYQKKIHSHKDCIEEKLFLLVFNESIP